MSYRLSAISQTSFWPTADSREPRAESKNMAKQSKRYRALATKRKEDAVPVAEAVKTLKTYEGTKFDQSVEIAIRLGIDNTQAEQIVRGSIVLPHGTGKSQRVLVFAKGAKAEEAKAAGAEYVG